MSLPSSGEDGLPMFDFFADSLKYKDEGNRILIKKDSLGAIAAYKQALACLMQFEKRHPLPASTQGQNVNEATAASSSSSSSPSSSSPLSSPTSAGRTREERDQLRWALNANIAQAYLNQGEWEHCIQACNIVLGNTEKKEENEDGVQLANNNDADNNNTSASSSSPSNNTATTTFSPSSSSAPAAAAIALTPLQLKCLFRLSKAYLGAGKLKEAEAHASRLLALQPEKEESQQLFHSIVQKGISKSMLMTNGDHTNIKSSGGASSSNSSAKDDGKSVSEPETSTSANSPSTAEHQGDTGSSSAANNESYTINNGTTATNPKTSNVNTTTSTSTVKRRKATTTTSSKDPLRLAALRAFGGGGSGDGGSSSSGENSNGGNGVGLYADTPNYDKPLINNAITENGDDRENSSSIWTLRGIWNQILCCLCCWRRKTKKNNGGYTISEVREKFGMASNDLMPEGENGDESESILGQMGEHLSQEEQMEIMRRAMRKEM